MNDAVLLMQVWPGNYHTKMMELIRPRHEKYCKLHEFDFECLIGTRDEKYSKLDDGSWVKVEMMRDALAKGYKYVVSLEPDTLIADMDADLRDGCPKGVGACFHRAHEKFQLLPQWNVGAIYIQNSQESKDFVDAWLAAWPGDRVWRDNGAFNDVGRKGRVVQTISDKWNATLNVSMVPDAVVIGFHGNGDSFQRYELMRQTMEKLEVSK